MMTCSSIMRRCSSSARASEAASAAASEPAPERVEEAIDRAARIVLWSGGSVDVGPSSTPDVRVERWAEPFAQTQA